MESLSQIAEIILVAEDDAFLGQLLEAHAVGGKSSLVQPHLKHAPANSHSKQ